MHVDGYLFTPGVLAAVGEILVPFSAQTIMVFVSPRQLPPSKHYLDQMPYVAS